MPEAKGHIYPIGTRVQKRTNGRKPKPGCVVGHTYVIGKHKARLPFYLILFDESSKPETVSGSVLSLEGADISNQWH